MNNHLKIESVPVDDIVVGARHRALDQDKVLQLATNIEEVGLLQPITVFRGEDSNVSLVAGYHRLEAVKALNWTSVDAIFFSSPDCEMAELAENLVRFDLTKEQRDDHIRRYAALLEEREKREPVSENSGGSTDAPEIGYKKPPEQKKGIASKVAAATGISKSTVNRVLNPKPQRVPAAVMAVAEALNARAAEKAAEPKERAPYGLKELARAWLNASEDARKDFMRRHNLIEAPKPTSPTIELTVEKPTPATNAYAAAKSGEARIIQPADMPKEEEPFTPPDFLLKDKGAA